MTMPGPGTPDDPAPSMRTLAANLHQGAALPESLAAGLAAFETIQDLARRQETADPDLFAAFMTAACAAADGLDALTAIPAVTHRPVIVPPGDVAGDPGQAADSIAELAAVLADRLQHLTKPATNADERRACEDAAQSARQIHDVMTRRR